MAATAALTHWATVPTCWTSHDHASIMKAVSHYPRDVVNDEPVMLDLTRFESQDDAISQISDGRALGFDDVIAEPLKAVLAKSNAMTYLLMFAMSAISRARALHEAIRREIEQHNPQAVFVLMRAFAETLLVMAYVADHPQYVMALIEHPGNAAPNGPKRKSIQALINHMDNNYAEQFKLVYAELSEMTHYGSSAIWNPYTAVDGEEAYNVTWASPPRWKDERQMYVACAQLLELSSAMDTALLRLVQRLDEQAGQLRI